METLIYGVGLVVVWLLVLYAVLFFFYLILKLKASDTPLDSMPAMKPVPIPTKNQKSWLHKLVVFVFDIRKWELTENWHYRLTDEDEAVELVIPAGFRFDGASIPRPLWAILSPVGVLLLPGLLHDYAYKYDQLWKVGPDGCPVSYRKGAGKEYWDDLFKKVSREVNGFHLIGAISWLAVALGGEHSWKKHRDAGLTPDKPDLETCGG